MYATQDKQRLYLNSWNYNAVLILSELANIVVEHGGRVEPPRYTAIITNRSIEIERLSSVPNEPIEVPGQNWIHFVLDGKVYSLLLDDNPFFEFHYSKTPLRDDGRYSLDACIDVFDKSWVYNCLLSSEATAADRCVAANEIFRILTGAKDTRIIRDSRRVRVPNTYDGGYHMETVFDKEHLATINY